MDNEGIEVLNAFDGISCGMLALERAGLKVKTYYSSEIDKKAIFVSKNNYPGIKQVGDIRSVRIPKGKKIDLLLAGSPCQGFSFAGKGLNFEDPRSKLFFEFHRIFKECKRYNPELKFKLENVVMKQEYQDIITDLLGVEPILINSRLVSGQNRKRLYWTNIKDIDQPQDKEILFSDIVPNGFCAGMRGRRIPPEGTRSDYDRSIPITQYIECRKDGKSNCLTTVDKDNIVVDKLFDRVPLKGNNYRYLTPEEYEQLQTLPIGYTAGVSDNQRKKLIGNAWNVDTVAHIFKYLKF